MLSLVAEASVNVENWKIGTEIDYSFKFWTCFLAIIASRLLRVQWEKDWKKYWKGRSRELARFFGIIKAVKSSVCSQLISFSLASFRKWKDFVFVCFHFICLFNCRPGLVQLAFYCGVVILTPQNFPRNPCCKGFSTFPSIPRKPKQLNPKFPSLNY